MSYHYSIVDITLDKGRGAVVEKNVTLLTSGTEKLTAVSRCNGREIWIITHKFGTDEFYSYLLTSAGLSTQPAISSAGPPYDEPSMMSGYLQASPDGNRLVAAAFIPGMLQIYDFDKKTGQVSNAVTLMAPDVTFYGACFSPDNSKLYGSSVLGMFQFDLSSNDPARIIASRTLITPRLEGAIQNGADGRIYVASLRSLDVIERPNAPGAACEFRTDPFSSSLDPFTNLGLPNPVVTLSSPADTRVSPDTIICAGGSVRLWTSSVTSSFWSPSDGLSCTSCSDPIASPDTTTTYMVRSNGDGGSCIGGPDTAYVTVTVEPPPTAIVASVDTICAGSSTRLIASGGIKYSWKPPHDDLSCTDCPEPIVRPPKTTTYTVLVTGRGGCTDSASITVTVADRVAVAVEGNVTTCAGFPVELRATGARHYRWKGAADLNCDTCAEVTTSPSVTTRYMVIGRDAPDCPDTAYVTVTVVPKPVAVVTGSTTICVGSSTRLTASGGVRYSWTPAEGLSCSDCPDPLVSPTSTTTYVVVVQNDAGCVDSAAITLTVADRPAVDAGDDRTICSGSSAQLNATGAMTYTWTPTLGLSCSDCPNPFASPPVTTLYRVVGSDPLGCTGEDSVTVIVGRTPTIDAGRDTIICPGDVALLRGTADAVSMSWSPPDGLDCPTCPTTHARPSTTTRYFLTAVDKEGCIGTDSVDVIVGKGGSIVRAAVDRGEKVGPASATIVPVRLLDPVEEGRINRIGIALTFDSRVVRIDDIDLRSSLLEEWGMDERIIDNVRGTVSTRLTAPSGVTLKGDGILLYLHLRGYIGNADSSELGLSVELPGTECLAVKSMPGLLRIDSICGLSLRLIEGNAEGYSLDRNRPNPFNPTTEIEFSLGLDGPTRLEIRDAGGRLVAILVDERMKAGRYVVTWDASALASGVYYYRLTSGTWSRTGAMTLVK